MQLFAYQSGEIVHATFAKRTKNYRCPECLGRLRVKGGLHKQNHFFHLKRRSRCRQSKKNLTHLEIQRFIASLLPSGEGRLERPFPEVRRIGDVVWEEKKIVFEVQCSPISQTEVEERVRDYGRAGFTVVWILHDKRYNKRSLGAAECIIRDGPSFYVKTPQKGDPIIYDQYELVQKARRSIKGDPLRVDLAAPHPPPLLLPEELLSEGLQARNHLYFKGDLIDTVIKKPTLIQDYKRLEMFENPVYPKITLRFVKQAYTRMLRHYLARIED